MPPYPHRSEPLINGEIRVYDGETFRLVSRSAVLHYRVNEYMEELLRDGRIEAGEYLVHYSSDTHKSLSLYRVVPPAGPTLERVR